MTKVAYALKYKKSVDKDLRTLPTNVRISIIKKIQDLSVNPFPSQSTKLQGSNNLHRLRHATYRIIYQVNGDELTILVIKIGHRKDVYRDI